MLVKNVSQVTLELALNIVNQQFDNNVRIATMDPQNKKGDRFRFTLKTLDSRGAGSKRTIRWSGGRHTPYACWHVYGRFFDAVFALRPDAVFIGGRQETRTITSESGNWVDYEVGSEYYTVWASEECQCS